MSSKIMYIDFLENQPLVTLGLSSSHGESQLDVTGSHPGTEDQPFGVPGPHHSLLPLCF